MHTAAALHAVDDTNASVDTGPIDALFRAMCELKASDLHLSVGSPPSVRKDGRMQILAEGAAPLTPESLLSLLMPILPSINKREFHERHDTDFAYEIGRHWRASAANVVHRSQGTGRGVPRHPREDSHGRATRALAAHPESLPAEQGTGARHRTRPARASRRRSAR